MDEKLFLSKIKDKAIKAFKANYQTNTGFLDLYEQSIFLNNVKEFSNINFQLFGGNGICERKIILFFPEDIQKEEIYIPIRALQITPTHNANKLTHRDYLGAILNLGIERYTIGDIFYSQQGAIVFCLDTIGDFILEELNIIKNLNVKINEIEMFMASDIKHEFDIIKGTVSSVRLDNIIKLGFSLSRTNATLLIQGKKTFINNKLIEKSSSKVEEGQIISLRGYGKIRLKSIGNVTKKGRIFIELLKYK